MSDLEEDTLTMTAWNHEVGTEKNAEKEREHKAEFSSGRTDMEEEEG